MVSLPHAGETVSADLDAALRAAAAQPLWDRYQRITTREPAARVPAGHWPWTQMSLLVERAAREVSLADAERRVLLLTPAGGAAATTTNLLAGLQTLLPGELARPHRHALQAIRFVVSGRGAVTTVNGEACAMEPGDLVLTPAWTWHEHAHPGVGRVVWLDGLDLPLVAHLDAMFFEPAQPPRPAIDPPPARPSALAPDMAVLRPDASDDAAPARGRFRYAWPRALAALRAATPRDDGSRWLRYVDAQGVGAVTPTIDCYLHQPARQAPATRSRSTASAVCVVAQGEGVSCVGGHDVAWQRHDVFTVPHWTWVTHQALSDDAVLFLMTDRELLATMGYLREDQETVS
jgi:gentisate 1,2-dioxygenase